MTYDITIIGLGAGDLDQLSLGVYKKLKQTEKCYVRTMDHPVIADLVQEGVRFESFDAIYEKHERFEEVYEEITHLLLAKAEKETVLYAVPGHPMVAEKTVQLLFEEGNKRKISVRVAGGQSFLDALFQSVGIDPIEGFQLLDGTALFRDDLQINQHIFIGQIYDRYVASDVKLTLMEKFPDDHEVFLVTAAGSEAESVKKIALYELDREMTLSNLTSLYVPPVNESAKRHREFSELRQIIAELRGPNGCPWDKKQTHRSLKPYLIEEAYEFIDAIDNEDDEEMINELGDVLLQVMLHAQIGEDEGLFSIEDVIGAISSKMVRRHPHVFGDTQVNGEEDVLVNWQKIKEEEKRESGISSTKSILDSVERSLPSLIRAFEYQKKAANVGFDWKEVSGAWNKVKEEIAEFEAEVADNSSNKERLTNELGDLFFSLVNVGRFYGIRADEAVYATNRKFYQRFTYIEERIKEDGKDFADYTLEELDDLWNKAKKEKD
jgi:tetrapyrrole methylase family protein / MazG family protein